MITHLLGPVLNLVGFSGSGKTTFIEKSIPWLKQQGYVPAYLKHSGHPHSLDMPGKDTTRQFEAGATFTALYNETQWISHHRGAIDEIWLQGQSNADLILLEGFKDSPYPKIILVHPEKGVPEEFSWKNLVQASPKMWAYLTADLGLAQSINEEVGYEIAFDRNQIAPIWQYLLQRLHWFLLSQTPLQAAVLIGGKSSRMGKDKAWLDYGHGPQAQYLFQLLSEQDSIQQVSFSAAPESLIPPGLEASTVRDQYCGVGPMGALLSVMEFAPQSAWFILACDLVNAGKELVEHLVLHRNPLKLGTFFTQNQNSLEPLAAIYEPRARYVLYAQWMRQNYSLQNFSQSAIEPLSVPIELAPQLTNINTTEERAEILRKKG